MSSVTGYNLFLIIVTVVAAFIIAAVTLYLLVAFSHPEDRMQAWWPKIVVCFSMFISIVTVLLFPLDVANRGACDEQILFSDCDLTLPMKEIWYGVYIVNVLLVYIITPFTLFYYEADSDLCAPHAFVTAQQFEVFTSCKTLFQRIRSAIIFTVLSIFVFGVILAILYGVGGYVQYDTTLLTSATVAIDSFQDTFGNGCSVPPGQNATACSALADDVLMETWEQRPSFMIFVVAVASILGWLLLMVMGGVGLVALPLDMITAFFQRPNKTISKSEYIEEAKNIGQRAKALAGAAAELKKTQEASGRNRKLRQQAKVLGKELSVLEDDEKTLESLYPQVNRGSRDAVTRPSLLQGEDRDSKWVFYVLSFWFSLFGGILFAGVAISWIIHIIVYVIVDPPLHPFLNSMFEALDDVFVFFGVIAFSVWCFFLILASIKGFTKLGLNFGLIKLYPMKLGATMMSSFLVNSALILLCSTAVVQFCARAFEAYAKETAIQEVFGNEIFNLQSTRWLFGNNVFIYIMLAFSVLTVLWLMIMGPQKQRHKKLSLEEIYAMG